jgi:hypothetical protein
MLITKEIDVRVGKNKKYYDILGYNTNVKKGQTINIKIEHLSKGSHIKVLVSCDYCHGIIEKEYREYFIEIKDINMNSCSKIECSNQKIKDVCLKKYGVENPFQAGFVKEKIKDTLIEKYGVEHPMFIQETKDKIKDTCVEKYGVDSYTKTLECQEKTKKTNLDKYGATHESKTEEGQLKRKLTRLGKGTQIPDEKLSDYYLYQRKVRNITHLSKKDLIKRWDGFDFYDNEYIGDNWNLESNDSRFPNIDHKISVFNGYINNIEPDIIGNINNLCITKSKHNLVKNSKNYDIYLKELKKAKD